MNQNVKHTFQEKFCYLAKYKIYCFQMILTRLNILSQSSLQYIRKNMKIIPIYCVLSGFDTSSISTHSLAWISNRTHYKVFDEITYPFPNFNGATVEVWELIRNFIAYFTGHVLTYSCWDWSKSRWLDRITSLRPVLSNLWDRSKIKPQM